MVLAAPMVVLAALGMVHRPTSTPVVRASLDHVSLYEGQGTRSRLDVTSADGVEHVTRISAQAPYVALHPASGRVSGLVRDGVPVLEVSPRRWGRRTLGEERVALTSPWAGYRWGPVLEHGSEMSVLPSSAPFVSAAEAPQPLGLVGIQPVAADGRGGGVRGHPAVPCRRPDPPGQLARLAAQRRAARDHLAGRGGQRRPSRRRRAGGLRAIGRRRRRGQQPRRDDARRVRAGRTLRAQRATGSRSGS